MRSLVKMRSREGGIKVKQVYCRRRDRQGLYPYVNQCTGIMQLTCRSKCKVPGYYKGELVLSDPKKEDKD